MNAIEYLDGNSALQPEIEQEYLKQSCIRCPLAAFRRNIVWGAGNRSARIMVYDSQPSGEEDDQGLPFIGVWGELLEKIWGEVGLRRSDLFLTVKTRCRPLNDREPTSKEVDACTPFLVREIMEVQPQTVVSLDTRSREPFTQRDPTVKPYRIVGQGPDIYFAMVSALHPKVWLSMDLGSKRDLVFQHMMSDWQMIARMAEPAVKIV